MPIGIAEHRTTSGVLQPTGAACTPVRAPSPHLVPSDGVRAGDPSGPGPGPGPDEPPTLEPLPTLLLLDIAVGLAEVPGLWRDHLGDGSAHRAVRLLATESYEAWVVSWADDGLVDVHDHGSSSGAVVVVSGALTLLDGRGRKRRTLAPGSAVHLPVGTPHDFVAVGSEPSASVHVFSPPLSSLGAYDATGARVGDEPVCPPAAVHDAASYVRARELHRQVPRR